MSMETSRPMTRSPVALAKTALRVAREALPAYASRFSKHDFTQHQLFAILVLRQFFKADYRGIVALLADLPDLQRTLGLTKVPHYSTLCYAEKRLLKGGRSIGCWTPSSPRLTAAA